MKNVYLFLLVGLFSIKMAYTQINTSPTDVGTPCFIDKFVMGHVYVNNTHYVAVDLPYADDRIEKYDNNCNFLGVLTTLPNFGPSGFKSQFFDMDMLYYNNSLYFYAEIDAGDETAILRYDINTKIVDVNNRLSFKGEAGLVRTFKILDNTLFISFSGANNNFTVAIAADWDNPIPTQYDTAIGNAQTFIFEMDASDMSNPNLFTHLKDVTFHNGIVENGIVGIHSGSLLLRLMRNSISGSGLERDIFFKEVDLTTGLVVHTQFYEGDATIAIMPNDDLVLTLASYNYTPSGGNSVNVKRNVVYLLDSDWNEKMNSGAQMSDNGNHLRNIHIVENSIIIEGGIRNYDYTSLEHDQQQSWMYFFLRKNNFQKKFIASGELLERWPSITNPLARFTKYDFSDNGFSAIGAYDSFGLFGGVPTQGFGPDPVYLDGAPLIAANSDESISVFYRRNIVIPSENFTIQIGKNGVLVLTDKKLVGGVITDSDEFDSVLVIDDTVDLNSWLGNIIDPSYIDGGEVTGWSVWANYAQYGLGNVQTNTTRFFC